MQNCPLLDVCKKEPIQISWKGNEECFSKNRNNLDLAFGGGSLSWKRDGQKGTYPLHIRYKPKFVPFSHKLIWKDVQSINNESAFLHFFFACPMNAEDYRYNVRPVVSDWFAKVNELPNVQWLIIFDSSHAKEKKIRNAVWDRLRSDFAKYICRLIEINDSSNATEKNAFFSVIQSTLITSFNTFVNTLQSTIQKLKSCDDSTPHFLPRIVNLSCKLSLFYWNLGLIENALHELDDVDVFLTSTFSRCQESDIRGKSVKRLSPFGGACLYLGMLMRRNAIDETTASIAELRAFVLAHHVLLTFHMFHQRYVVMVGSGNDAITLLYGETLFESSELLRRDDNDEHVGTTNGNSSPVATTDEELLESTNEMAFQLCHNFVAFVWRYVHDALCHLIEDLTETKVSYSSAMLYILVLIWYDEITACCKTLGDLCRMENASYFICQMTFMQCDALKKLSPVLFDNKAHFNEITVARQWFERTAVEDGCEPSTSTFAEFNVTLFGADGDRTSLTAFMRRKYLEAQEIFRNFGYARHLEAVNVDVIELIRESDEHVAFAAALENYRLSLAGKSTYSTAHWASQMIYNFGKLLVDNFPLLFDCYLVLAMDNPANLSKFIEVVHASTMKHSISNLDWRLPHKFPWRVLAAGEPLIHCDFHKKIRLNLKIESPLLPNPAPFVSIAVKATFRSLSADNLRSAQLLFKCSTISAADQKKLQRFTCVSSDQQFSSESRLAESAGHDVESITFDLNATSDVRISEHVTELVFEGEANSPGCFTLDSLAVDFYDKCSFHLDYGAELRRDNALTAVLCFVNTKLPKVTLLDYDQAKSCLLAGVTQKLAVELNAGTLATEVPTELAISFVGAKPAMKFLNNEEKSWCKAATIGIPQLRAEETLRREVVFCLDIDRMNSSVNQSLLLRYDLKVDWLGRTWFFALNFLPIISLKSMTSQLGDRVLFEVDLQRCDSTKSLRILPEEAILLQDQSVANSPVEAVLLNPKPLEPILANSSYRFVWQLPNSKISKIIPITHFIKLAYSVAIDADGDLDVAQFMPPKTVIERRYLFENKLTFTVQKVEYEVCAHVLSERPQLVLCRVDGPCDLIVSLRSLTSGVPESIIVVVEVDLQFWTAVDKFKVVHIKGSGIGQTSFTIIPNRAGYLPYPNIFVHRHINANQNDRCSFNETTCIGERLNSFHRNQGKQIHVLAQLHASEDTSSVGSANTLNSSSTKKTLKSQAKNKIQKFFELRD